MLKRIAVSTTQREQLIDITSRVREIIRTADLRDGLATVFVPHTTAGVTINENADPSVVGDILYALKKISPAHPAFRHAEGNSDAHVKASLIGPSLQLIVADGEPVLGTWQGIYFCEFDGPRSRTCCVKLLREADHLS